jgi:hypothetical protein
METYTKKLVASGTAVAAAATNSGKPSKGISISGFDWLCCSTNCAKKAPAVAEADEAVPQEQQEPKGPQPLRVVLSPVALLVVLAYAAATGFYLYTRASRIHDLGPQWW